MKNSRFLKLYSVLGLIVLFALPVSRVEANISKEQVKEISPLLNQALSQMTVALIALNAEINAEQRVVDGDIMLLRSYSRTISSNPPPTLSVLLNIKDGVVGVGNDLTHIRNFRTSVSTTLGGIANSFGSLLSLINSSV